MQNNNELNLMAELRLIDALKLDELMKVAELERIEEEVRFLWTKKKKVSYIDHYDDFIQNHTKLLASFDFSGFLLFDDLYRFLKDVKHIDLKSESYYKYEDHFIELRDELVILIDYLTAQKLIQQFDALIVSEQELFDFDPDTKAMTDINPDVISVQIHQIKELGMLLKRIMRAELLFIRSFY
jgi:hypothetical protein